MCFLKRNLEEEENLFSYTGLLERFKKSIAYSSLVLVKASFVGQEVKFYI